MSSSAKLQSVRVRCVCRALPSDQTVKLVGSSQSGAFKILITTKTPMHTVHENDIVLFSTDIDLMRTCNLGSAFSCHEAFRIPSGNDIEDCAVDMSFLHMPTGNTQKAAPCGQKILGSSVN